MDPLGDYSDSDGRGLQPTNSDGRVLPTPVEDEFPNLDNEETNSVSILRSVQIFLNDSLSDNGSPSILKSSLSEKQTDEEDPLSTDLLNVEINYADIRRDEVKGDSVYTVEGSLEEGCDGVVIKQEMEWEAEEIDIVDDHLDNLSECPRKRIRELKILLRKETEDNFESWNRTEGNNLLGNEKRYSLRQRDSGRNVLPWKSDCKPYETIRDGHDMGDIWSDDSDNDPDYAPHVEETEKDYQKTIKKTKRKFSLPIKKSYGRKLELKKLFCLYCKNKYKIIVRHLLTTHSNEPEVKIIISLPMRSKERKDALAAFLKKVEENDARKTEEDKQNMENVNVKEIKGSKKCTPRVHYKWSVCFYCKKRLRKMSRHLIFTHSNEPYVKYLMRLPKGSEERKSAFKLITNKGNFAYNQEVIASGKGSIISSRTQSNQDQIHTFSSCNYCFGFYKKGILQKHREKCFQSYNCESNFEEITRNYKGEEDSQGKMNGVKKRKKMRRRKLKPIPANIKASACLYCKERVRSLSRHLIRYHGDKSYMKHLLGLPKGSEERKIAWKLIRNKGNFVYNKEIIAKGGGPIISTKMQKGRDQTRNFLPCSYCLGFYKKQLLQKHQENCFKKSDCNKITNIDDENEDWNVIPPDCSPMDIIQNLVKGNLVGEESDLDLKIKKKSTKMTACYYCNKLTTKLMRHLEQIHLDKPNVKHILSLEKGSKERYHALQAIRRKGNFLYNKASLDPSTDGTFITRRKSGHNKLKYLPCEFCFGFFRFNTLIKHIYQCERNTMSAEAKNEELKKLSEFKRKQEIKTFCTTLLNCPTSCSSKVNQILLSLKNTKIGTVAKNDELISKFGAYHLERGKMSIKLIARKMCCLANLVVRVNVFEKKISNLFESFSADYFKTVLKAALQICMTTKEKFAIRREKSLRMSIRHCCMIAKSDSLFRKDDSALKQVNDFFVLFLEHWSKLFLPTLLEASEIADHKDKVNEPEANGKINHVSVIDSVKQDFLQYLSVDKNHASDANNLDHCSSLFGTKKNVCLFCNKKYTNIRRHWINSHQGEPEIKKFAKLDKFSKERKSILIALRNKGNYLHNKSVLQQKKGCLFRKRGRAVLNGYSDYLPCEYCLGFYKAKRLSSHFKCCPLNPLPDQGTPINMRIRSKLQIPLMMNELESESLTFNVLVDQIKNLGLKQTVKNDDLIIKCGRIYLSLNPKCQRTCQVVRYRLCNLARVLDHCKKCNSQIKTLSACFQSENFGYVLSAIKEMSCSRSTKPSALRNFSQLRFSILTCVLILKNEGILKNSESNLEDLKDCEVMLNHCVLSAQDFKQYDDDAHKGKVKNWRKEDTDAISTHFSNHIKKGVIPGKLEIEEFLNQHENLKSQDWLVVKYKIRNVIAKIERHSSRKEKMKKTDNIGSHVSSDRSEALYEKHKKNIDETCNLHELVQPTDEFQTKKQINEEIPSLLFENTSLQCGLPIPNEQVNSRKSSDSLMEDLEDLCDEIRMPSLHKPLVTIESQIDKCNENLPSDDEERTYLLLSSCDYSQQEARFEIQGPGPSVETASLTPKDAFDNSHSNEQLVRLELSSPAPVARYKPNTQEFHTKNEFVAICQTGPRSTLSSDLLENSTLTQPMCHQSNREGNYDSQEENKQRSNSSIINNIIPISSSVGCNGYKNKGWREDEINAVLSFFSKNIKRGKVPSKVECLDCIEENQCLSLRDWVSVKSKVHYIISSNKKTNLKPNDKNKSSLKTTEKNKSLVIADTQESNDISAKSDLGTNFLSSSRKRKILSSVGCNRYKNKGWREDEINAVLSFFSKNINRGKVPSKIECLNCIEENQCLSLRDWVSVKSKVHYIIRSKKIMPNETNKSSFKKTENNKSLVIGDQQVSPESDLGIDFLSSSKKSKVSQKETGKQQWTLDENAAIASYFKEHINNFTVPGKKDCEQCISLNKGLASRSWVMVKSKVHNIISYNKRKIL